MIGIINYGAGNLFSVQRAFDYLGYDTRLVTRPGQMEGLDRLVLPGVGAFGAAVDALKSARLWLPLRRYFGGEGAFLGICLGMQLVFERSEESPQSRGLAFFSGFCRRFRAGRIPQIGWNRVFMRRKTPLLEGIPSGTFFYHLHAYHVISGEESLVAGETDYHGCYPSIIAAGRFSAVQFHPEKSGAPGLQLLDNWVKRC